MGTDDSAIDWLALMHQAQSALRAGRWASQPVVLPEGLSRLETEILGGLYWRCVGLFDAVCVLADHELVSEAVILARPLFVESLWLDELSLTAGNGRMALLIRFANDGISDMVRATRDAAALGAANDLEATVHVLEEQRSKLLTHGQSKGVGKLPSFPDTKQMAETHGRTDDLLSHRMSHEFVHESDVALSRRRTDEQELNLFAQDSDPRMLAELCIFSGRSILRAHGAFCRCIGFPVEKEVEDTLEEINRANDEMASGATP